MSTGVGVRLYVDGQRFADGCTGEPDTAPAALSGLEVVWGRETTVDQPEASTCTFEVVDPVGGVSFIDQLRTGVPVRVEAVGTTWPDPTVPTWPDPGFETADPAAITTTTNAAASISTARHFEGARSLQLEPVDPTRRAGAIIAPAPFVPAGDDPAAWDAIPATALGQTWSLSVRVWAPPGAVVLVRPVLFTGPWRQAAQVDTTVSAAITGDGTWQLASFPDLVPDVAGAWYGVQVSAYPTGPTWDQLPANLTWDTVDPAWTWDDYARFYVDDVQVLAPAAGVERAVLVYAGRIASLADAWADEYGAPVIEVSCVDFTADLENRPIGDDPWTVEPLGDRFERILTLAGSDVTADLDPGLAAFLVTWRDVDATAAAGLLVELAESVDGVLWSATHATTGPYYVLEDPATRLPLYVLEDVAGTIVIVPNPGQDVLRLSACDVLRDEVTWSQDVTDVITRAAVTWQEQGTDDDGEPTTTDRTVQVIDSAAEAVHGSRRLSLSTQLQDQGDALEVANRLLARTSDLDWRASGVAVDDDDLDDGPATVDLLLTLLDGTTRNGLPVQLVDLPAWAPAGPDVGVNLEGGSYRFEGGRWVCELIVSNYSGQGASVTWDELDPLWTWDDFAPSITWDDLRGVGA